MFYLYISLSLHSFLRLDGGGIQGSPLLIDRMQEHGRHHELHSYLDNGRVSQCCVRVTRSTVYGTTRPYLLHAEAASSLSLSRPVVRHFIFDCGCYCIRQGERARLVPVPGREIRRQAIADCPSQHADSNSLQVMGPSVYHLQCCCFLGLLLSGTSTGTLSVRCLLFEPSGPRVALLILALLPGCS